MNKSSHPLAVALQWLALVWLVGWALYVTFWSELAHTTQGLMVAMAALLVPTAVAFSVAWAIDRAVSRGKDSR